MALRGPGGSSQAFRHLGLSRLEGHEEPPAEVLAVEDLQRTEGEADTRCACEREQPTKPFCLRGSRMVQREGGDGGSVHRDPDGQFSCRGIKRENADQSAPTSERRRQMVGRGRGGLCRDGDPFQVAGSPGDHSRRGEGQHSGWEFLPLRRVAEGLDELGEVGQISDPTEQRANVHGIPGGRGSMVGRKPL